MNHNNFAGEHLKALVATPLIAVLVVDDVSAAVEACRALVRGGVPAVELALRTGNALDCIEAVVRNVPEILPIAGTVLTREQLDELSRRGVTSAVAPGCNPDVIDHARELGISFAPGVCTPSDIEVAIQHGCTLIKYFPAEPSGGLAMLTSMAGPYAHLGLQFIPLGGLREHHVVEYLSDDLILAVGGTWIAPADLVAAKAWDEIESRALSATKAIDLAGKARAGGAQ